MEDILNFDKIAPSPLQVFQAYWQPIETAPNDCSRLLVLVDGEVWTGWVSDKGHVYIDLYDEDSIPAQSEVTHWMPLPIPPKQDSI